MLKAIEGGATVGYWDTGNRFSARLPARTMAMAITQANTGRSMKNLASTARPLLLLGRDGRCSRRCGGGGDCARLPGHRLHRTARAGLLQAIDDHLFAALEALADDPVGACHGPGLHGQRRHLAVLADGHHDLSL